MVEITVVYDEKLLTTFLKVLTGNNACYNIRAISKNFLASCNGLVFATRQVLGASYSGFVDCTSRWVGMTRYDSATISRPRQHLFDSYNGLQAVTLTAGLSKLNHRSLAVPRG